MLAEELGHRDAAEAGVAREPLVEVAKKVVPVAGVVLPGILSVQGYGDQMCL